VCGAPDPKGGALGTLYSVHADERLNHSFEVVGGARADESAYLLSEFFSGLRNRKKAEQYEKFVTGFYT